MLSKSPDIVFSSLDKKSDSNYEPERMLNQLPVAISRSRNEI